MNREPYYDAYEIDLRKIVRAMLKDKWIILGGTVLFVCLSWLASLFLVPNLYQSSASIRIAPPVMLEDRQDLAGLGAGEIDIPGTKALAGMASDERNLPGFENSTRSDANVRFHATHHGENQIVLTVTTPDRDEAASLANQWAEEYASWLNETYSLDVVLATMEDQLDAYQKRIAAAQTALEEAENENQVNLLAVRLERTKTDLLREMVFAEQLADLLAILRDVDDQLAQQDQTSSLSVSQRLALLSLQQRAISGTNTDQVIVTSPDIFPEGYVIASARQDIGDWMSELEDQRLGTEVEIDVLEEALLSLSAELSAAENQIYLYRQDRDLQGEIYSHMVDRIKAVRSTYYYDHPFARVIVHAQVPERPSSPSYMKNILVGGIVGLSLSMFVVFLGEWLREPNDEELGL